VVNVVHGIIANCGVFMQHHAHDAKVASTRYVKANGCHPPSIMT
jgi:hypothetical protein